VLCYSITRLLYRERQQQHKTQKQQEIHMQNAHLQYSKDTQTDTVPDINSLTLGCHTNKQCHKHLKRDSTTTRRTRTRTSTRAKKGQAVSFYMPLFFY